MPPHPPALTAFARHLRHLLALRAGLQLATVWLFFWGVVVLALRVSHTDPLWAMAVGGLGLLPILPVALWLAHRQQPSLVQLRATYDHLNACGGLLMAQEVADMEPWLARLPATQRPQLHWRSGRLIGFFGAAALFAAVALLLPERMVHLNTPKPLAIGQLVQQLEAEVQTLAQEKILEEKKSTDLLQQLDQLQKEAASNDPNHTWEALDHIKEANAQTARQAAEEVAAKSSTLAEAQTLAQALKQAGESGLNEATAKDAAQNLADLLHDARLETGLLNSQLPPELLAGLKGAKPESLDQLLKNLDLKKATLHQAVSNLANLKLIDPATLSKCQKAGTCKNPGGLAAYLSSCTNGCNKASLSACMKLGRGGPGGGGPEAPMTWTDGTSEKDTKFQAHALPPAASLSDAQLVGVSQAAPEISDRNLAAEHGALDNTLASGGSAHAQTVLPEHRQAVQRFFKRESQ
jgi:hypothetical protein